MKPRLPILLVTLACAAGIATSAGAQSPARTWRGHGPVTNLAVDKSGTVTLTVSTSDSIAFTTTGQFGDGLFGRFTLNGELLPTCQPDHICLQFSGALQLGGEGGWPEGTTGMFILTLVLAPTTGKGTGVYHIGPLPSLNFHQDGVLDLTLN